MSLKIKESELKALLDEVAADLSKAFESEKDKLAKADLQKGFPPGEETPGEDESAPPSPEEGSESAAPTDAPPADSSPAEAPPDASAAPADPAADPAGALTPEALTAEYLKLPPEELDMHIQAAMAAKAQLSGAPDASAGAPPAPPMAPPAGPPPAAPPMAMKSEMKINAESTGGKISKSEAEELKALVKSQSEDIANLSEAIKLMLEKPQRKAVTSITQLTKSESAAKPPLTKESIQARLKQLSMKPDLKKSDRQLINDFYDGRIQADGLAPLFEDYK